MSHRDHTPDLGAASGIATLDGSSVLTASQLPAATESVAGGLEVGTQAEVDAGALDDKIVTPAKLGAKADSNPHHHDRFTDIDTLASITLPLYDQPNPFMSTNNTSYQAAAQFIFPGTSNITTAPNLARVIASASSAAASSGYRLFDVTNGLTIAEATIATSPTAAIESLGAVSNLPASEAIFELQFRRVSGGSVRMSYFELRSS